MWRFALLWSVLTLTLACADGPAAPSANTNEPSLQLDGDPPPPPLDGGGLISLSPTDNGEITEATESVTQQVCVPPNFVFAIEGDYFQNKSEKNARVHFTPVPGSGAGTIHETANNPDPSASGTLVVLGSDGQQYQIHLVDYIGNSLFDYDRGDFAGFIFGALLADVTACGERIEYTGTINFSWVCSECGEGGEEGF